MSKMYFLPFRPAFDSAGITVPGSQHYFTLAGTNTPSAPFTAATLATHHENPLVSNGIGYLPPVYLDPDISYRIRVYAEDAEVGVDTPLEEYDPYVPALVGSDVFSALADSDGASFVTFDPTVTYPSGSVGAVLSSLFAPLMASPNYVGMDADDTFTISQGTSATPSTTQGATMVVQKVSSAVAFQTFAVFAVKKSSAAGARATASYAEASDALGGITSFIEGGRMQATLLSGAASGSAYGQVTVASAVTGATTPQYLIGHEAVVDNHVSPDAAVYTSFDKNAYWAGYVATNGSGVGTRYKGDAGFVTNPYSSTPFRTGLLFAENSVDDTAIAGRAGLSIVNGVDFSRATLSGSFAKRPNNIPNTSRNAAGTADLETDRVDASDILQLGGGTSGVRAKVSFGYATGSGGTVTQITSKVTAVILNKICGAITLNNASLAANTVVSFTLTNSMIAADDDVRVWVKSGNAGVGTYRVAAEGNASGSRSIVVENKTAGALAETLVLGFEVLKVVIA